MSSLVYILVAIIVWMAYTMYKSYTGLQKELREIRLKCMKGSGANSTSEYTSEPVSDMRNTMLTALTTLANMSRPVATI